MKKDLPELAVDQIWQEVDNRFTRRVRILELTETRVTVTPCTASGKPMTGRKTRPSRRRFNGLYHGYNFFRSL